MDYRFLGRTGLKVSALALGTVSLGMEYGLKAPGEPPRPTEAEVTRLLQQGADAGINLFDTAPAYGESERLLGKALCHRHECYIATKVSIPRDDDRVLTGRSLQVAINGSLESSLKSLGRDSLDILQIHNATADMVRRGELAEILVRAREVGKVRFLGASVYGEEAALAVLDSGSFDVLQVAYSLLDQRMADKVLPIAHESRIGVICRSALLKGALSERARWLPKELSTLRERAAEVMRALAGRWEQLPQVALRFCLSSPYIGTVLIGASSQQELSIALEAASAGPLAHDLLEKAAAFALHDEELINPACWSVP